MIYNRKEIIKKNLLKKLIIERSKDSRLFHRLLFIRDPHYSGPLELRELTLGEQTPCITRVRTLDCCSDDDLLNGHHAGQTKLSIEADVRLDCEQFRMLITTRLFGKG